jgi:hypothetical protein
VRAKLRPAGGPVGVDCCACWGAGRGPS